ncbi:MAG: tyrosine-type recombinase/integrase [Spirochaetaceae bacterium]|nr:tyrosine-type recombinase/integrase [Spirochaetaceae bacterium]
MFEDLFTDRGTIARYRAASLLDERLSYLRHCAAGGFRPPLLRRIAAHQAGLVRLLDLHEGDRVSVARIEGAADQWSLPGGRRSSRPALPQARQRFVGHAVRWLRHMDMLEEPDAPRHRRADEVSAFEAWMRDERGWSEETVRGCLGTVDRFLEGLDEREVALGAIEAGDIDREAARWHARGCSRITVRDYAQRLRAFFRFAERRAWCRPGLAEGIMPPRFHPGEPLPKGLDREEVLRLLATAEGSRPADVRDRAILTVLIAYGLRAGEVAGLRLDDVDWEEETLRVRRPKLGRTHHYPLSRGVGQAILRYVRELRPSRPERTLFLTLSAPLRPLSGSAMSHVVRSRLDRIGITGKRRGPHALRHGAAQHLLDCGLSMKEVGDCRGHGSVSATSAYARVQLSALREVADIDLEGLA